MSQYDYKYRNYQDLSNTIKKNISALPKDFDLIVGIPRSGIIPAYMIALLLNKRVCSLDEFLSQKMPSNGERNLGLKKNTAICKVLIVDDSIASGNAQKLLRERLSKAKLENITIKTLAVYARECSKNMVDYYFEILESPRIFQWNYLNHPHIEKWCFDIDGVLCVDPTDEENDDGERYKKFLLSAPPLYIPKYEIYALVTSRLEKYRSETMQWLKQNGVRYKSLYMLDLPSKEIRQKLNAHASFKAEIYSQLPEATLFVESNTKQAKDIAILTGKPCISVENDKFFYEPVCLDKQILNVSPSKMDEITSDIKISVIMPIYNVSPFLQQALDTIRSQTLKEIEIICVDDESTDGSYDILLRNAQDDRRIRIIRQDHSGAGIARNRGMEVATGAYIIFLDPDDFFCLDMLEKTYNQILSSSADICIFQAIYFDNETGKLTHKPPELLRTDVISEYRTFSYKDIPNDILNITTGAPWNKLYRHEFIKNCHLLYQGIPNTNDAYFTMIALVEAKQITYLDEELIYYRRNIKSSLQATREKSPLAFEKAYSAIQDKLKQMGIYEDVKRSFINRALISTIYNLNNLKNYDSFEQVYNVVKNDLLEKYEIKAHSSSYFPTYAVKSYNQSLKIQRMSALTYWNSIKSSQKKKSKKGSSSKELIYKQQLADIQSSWSYKIGRSITFLPRKICGGIRCCQDHGAKYTIRLALKKLLRF